MKPTLPALILIVLLTACATERPLSRSAEQKEALINTLIAQNNFLGIFKHRTELMEVMPGNTTHLNKPLEKFILNCCSDKASAIKLLEDNGFKVTPIKDWSTRGYDEVFYGWRLSRPINFITDTRYRVSLHINNGKVQKVTGNSSSDFKPAKPHSPNYKSPRLNK